MYKQKDVYEAARRIWAHIQRTTGGELPVTVPEMRALLRLYYLRPAPVRGRIKTAALVCEHDGSWSVYYNVDGAPEEKIRWGIHEIAEYLSVADYPTLFDGLPGATYAYDGGDDPRDVHHRVAKRVEELYARELRKPSARNAVRT